MHSMDTQGIFADLSPGRSADAHAIADRWTHADAMGLEVLFHEAAARWVGGCDDPAQCRKWLEHLNAVLGEVPATDRHRLAMIFERELAAAWRCRASRGLARPLDGWGQSPEEACRAWRACLPVLALASPPPLCPRAW